MDGHPSRLRRSGQRLPRVVFVRVSIDESVCRATVAEYVGVDLPDAHLQAPFWIAASRSPQKHLSIQQKRPTQLRRGHPLFFRPIALSACPVMPTSLTVFKIKEGITDHNEIVVNRDRLRDFPVRVDGRLLGILYVQRNPLKQPNWLGFFQDSVDFEGMELRTTTAKAVLVIQRDAKNVFAVTFGYGRWMLQDTAIESRFGLRATLNAIDPANIRSIDHKRLEAISRQTREQLSQASGLQYFGMDVERDLLRAVTGTPRDETLADRLAGADQLTIVGDFTIQNLAAALDRFSQLSKQTTYRKDFGFVDFIGEVTDAALQPRLDAMLVARLRRRTPPGVWLAPPEIIDWDQVRGFRYRSGADAPVHPDVELDDYIQDSGPRRDITIERLRKDRVRIVSAIDGTDREHWTVYRCLVAELEIRDETYVLNEAKWYRVDRNFLQEVDDAVAALGPTNPLLPAFGQRSEQAYNRRVYERSAGRYALMDRQMVQSVGRGTVESCDLFSIDRQLIHVKRYTGSGTLSHLFNQGVVSAELLAYDRTFRQAFNELLPATHRLAQPAAAIVPSEYEVAYAIIPRRGRQLVLPFFSKVTMRNAARLLRQIGFRVSLTAIPNP